MRLAVVTPTGSGKTEMMATTVSDYLRPRRDICALVLSHLSLLTEQSFARFRLRAPHLSLGILQGKRRPSMMNDVVVSTMQTARRPERLAELGSILCKRVGILIVDETHMLPTASYEAIREHFPDVPLVGYTATPFREKKLMTNSFEKISFTISLQDLIDQGHLVPPRLHTIAVDAGEEHALIKGVTALYKKHEAGKKAIVYMRTIDEAKLLRNALEGIGVKARAVTSETVGKPRQEIFEAFTAGDTDVLCTVDVLTAGFDAPCVEAIFMPYGTKSPTQYLQRIGRGLRTAPGKTDCRIYMIGDAPKVMNKFYEKIHKLALHAGKKPGEHDTFRDELELSFSREGSEVYEWTAEVVKVIERMEKLGMENFAALLDQKKFPEHFMRSIHDLLARLPKNASAMPHAGKPASEAQKDLLFRAGFTSDQVAALNRGEASIMIGVLTNNANSAAAAARSEFILPAGMFAGKHVSETPFAYRKAVMKQSPTSELAKIINAWEARNQRRA